jgi:hypothetical protein
MPSNKKLSRQSSEQPDQANHLTSRQSQEQSEKAEILTGSPAQDDVVKTTNRKFPEIEPFFSLY